MRPAAVILKAVRLLLFTAIFPALLLAQTPKEIVERAISVNDKNQQLARSYTYLERQERRTLDGSGRVKERVVQTWDITPLEGSQYRRLVARDDKPLSAAEQKSEEEKLQKSLQDRRNETAGQRERRIADSQRRQDEREREPIGDLLNAFDFRLVAEETLDGHDAWVIDGTPRRGFKGKSTVGRALFPKLRCRFWINKADYQAIKVDAETQDTASLGVFLVRLSKGSHIVIEMARVNDEVWLPKRVAVTAAARILLVKSMRFDLRFDYSDYKKFQAESRVVETGSPER
jgi:hypothetical protein